MVSPTSCLSILVIPLLVTSLFYQVSNAVNDTYLDSICHKSTDYELCSSTFAADNRTSTADLDGLLLICISSNMNLLETTIVNRIPPILEILEYLVDKQRLQHCQSDFIYALGKLSGAYLASASKNYEEGTKLSMDAAFKNAECINEYNMTDFPSPIEDVPNKVGRLIFLSFVIVDEIKKY
ncbi:hypothetical protein ACB092_09G168900 [Castanea dentata]